MQTPAEEDPGAEVGRLNQLLVDPYLATQSKRTFVSRKEGVGAELDGGVADAARLHLATEAIRRFHHGYLRAATAEAQGRDESGYPAADHDNPRSHKELEGPEDDGRQGFEESRIVVGRSGARECDAPRGRGGGRFDVEVVQHL